MSSTKTFALAVMALASIPLMAQQPQTSVPETTLASTAPESAKMQPVNGELVGNLDSKSAKTGDSVVVKTTQSLKTAEGTEIPKGSKLVGTVTVVKPHSDANQNALMAVRFDHAELKGGQSMPIQSVIQSVAPSSSDAASNPADNAPVVMGTPTGGGMSGSSSMGSVSSSRPSAPVGSGAADRSVNGMGAGQGSATGNDASSGQVVGKLGDDPIRTTAIPGILLASNTPGEAAKFSGVFVAPKSDVHLSGGTQLVLGVSAAGGQ
ncbi:MAG: hypothetical protein WBQ94_17180 [Terracidiphilus sp.]